jgi:hypothetical protein
MLFTRLGRYVHGLNNQPYDRDSCFVCTEKLTEETRTVEHVIPLWMQNDFKLLNSTVTLLNGTRIQYRQLTVPCCEKCNGQVLRPMENVLSEAIRQGADAVRQLPRFELFRWLAKVYIGILYKEVVLPFDRANRADGPIIPPDLIQQFRILQHWLRCSTEPGGEDLTPGSLWIFDAQVPKAVEDRFDLADDPLNGVIAVRIGPVILAADFLENGIHRQISQLAGLEASGVPLHPAQFRELTAVLIYEGRLIDQRSRIRFYEDRNGSIRYTSEWEDASPFRVQRPWNNEDFVEVLSFYSGVDRNVLYQPPAPMRCWLFHGDYIPVEWKIGTPHPVNGDQHRIQE